jgi:hypothetical protein
LPDSHAGLALGKADHRAIGLIHVDFHTGTDAS